MKSLSVKIIDAIGIHARPAAAITSAASKFQSKIEFKIADGSKVANAKSIMNLLSLGAKKDTQLEIIIDGADEDNAIEEIKKVMLDQKLIEIL